MFVAIYKYLYLLCFAVFIHVLLLCCHFLHVDEGCYNVVEKNMHKLFTELQLNTPVIIQNNESTISGWVKRIITLGQKNCLVCFLQEIHVYTYMFLVTISIFLILNPMITKNLFI